MLYVIAGASLSGKTTTRRHITTTRSISGIDTDTLRTMANILRKDINVGHDREVMTNYKNMRPVVNAFIRGRSFFQEDYVLEGDCLNLEDMRAGIEHGEIKAVVLGYPEATVESLMEIVSVTSTSHWSRNLTDIQLRQKLKSFIDYSIFLKKEAQRLDLHFIDVSTRTDIEQTATFVSDQLFSL